MKEEGEGRGRGSGGGMSKLDELSRNSVGRSFVAASHLHYSAYRSRRLLQRSRNRGANSPLQREMRSWAPLQVELCLASAGQERSVRDFV